MTVRIVQSLAELELQYVREEVARVLRVARHVVLWARVEEVFATRRGRRDALLQMCIRDRNSKASNRYPGFLRYFIPVIPMTVCACYASAGPCV